MSPIGDRAFGVLRVSAFAVYLACWVILGVLATVSVMSRRRAPVQITTATIAGMLLQAVSPLPITLSLSEGPLWPSTLELAAALVLAPLGTALFGWVLRSGQRDSGAIVTSGPYRWVRHPMYLAFLVMLLATGLLVSAGAELVAAVALYIVGTELRIAVEESEMATRYSPEYAAYRKSVRWRYLPWVR